MPPALTVLMPFHTPFYAPLPAGVALGLQLLGRGVVAIGEPAGQQLFGRRLVLRQPQRLIVGLVRSADFRSLVPVDAQPAKAVQDGGQRGLDVAREMADSLVTSPPLRCPDAGRHPGASRDLAKKRLDSGSSGMTIKG